MSKATPVQVEISAACYLNLNALSNKLEIPKLTDVLEKVIADRTIHECGAAAPVTKETVTFMIYVSPEAAAALERLQALTGQPSLESTIRLALRALKQLKDDGAL